VARGWLVYALNLTFRLMLLPYNKSCRAHLNTSTVGTFLVGGRAGFEPYLVTPPNQFPSHPTLPVTIKFSSAVRGHELALPALVNRPVWLPCPEVLKREGFLEGARRCSGHSLYTPAH
jgi:hypothetical protein